MITITPVTKIEDKERIAILDTSSIAFMQLLSSKGIRPDTILKDYELILIPEWVLTEVNDSEGRARYLQEMIDRGYPVRSIAEERYSDLTFGEEGNLLQIVLASTQLLGRLRSYLRRFVEATDILDTEAYSYWIKKLYEDWPLQGEELSSGRIRKKNAGEVSITILTEVISWYYPETEALTVYSQDRDAFEFQRRAEASLREVFTSRTPVPVSFKSNDAILCQLFREGEINISDIKSCRKDERKITYSKEQPDHSVILVTEQVDNDDFVDLVQDQTVHIIF